MLANCEAVRHVHSRVTPEHDNLLTSEFQANEFRQALFSMHADTASGSDKLIGSSNTAFE